MPPSSAPMSWRAMKSMPDVLAAERDQAGRAVGGRDAEHDENGGHRAEQAGLPPKLAGMPHRPRGHIASTAARNRSPRSS